MFKSFHASYEVPYSSDADIFCIGKFILASVQLKMFHSLSPQKEKDISVEKWEKEKTFYSQKKISLSAVH